MTDQPEFERLIAALRPWLEQVVIVGGWAHRLHRAHPLAQAPDHEPVRTRDADVAFDTEFLTPLTGQGMRRDGSADATISRAGIVAQKLRHLEVLLVAPWRCPVGGGEVAVLATPVEVAVANPVSYVAQKLLIHASRAPLKRAQDILYLHDTIQLFGGSLEPLNALWRTDVSPSLTRNQRASVRDLRPRLFATVTDTIREAARIPVDRRLRPEEVREVCAVGLAILLSDD